MTLFDFYKRTGWLWVLFLIGLIVLAVKVMPIFWLGIPVLIAYSIYFGMVRVNEQNARN